MSLKDKLPVSYLLFTSRGRISRATYWRVSLFIWTSFYILYNLLEYGISYGATWFIYPVLAWSLICTNAKRLHDSDRSGKWLMLLFIPALGPVLLIFLLGFKKGSVLANTFGPVPGTAPDYFKNGDAQAIEHITTGERIVNDVTQLNPVLVAQVAQPSTIAALQQLVKHAALPISTGGGRFSMGGQTASPGSIHIDMRRLNRIISFSEAEKTIKVEAGIRWCDIQRYIDNHNLSIKIMQTYANFTVGGALSVNCHGRYIGLGPVILSVRSLEVITADGELIKTSREINPELFFACIGCYNAVAIIAVVEFDLADNDAVKRIDKKMPATAYKDFFFENIRENGDIIFHNADLYPTSFKYARAVSWVKTSKKPTEATRMMPLAAAYPVERYFISAFSRSRFGKWRREHIVDPLLYKSKKIHWRNYEAGYDVAELEPRSRKISTYVLQEYFIPVDHFDDFTMQMAEIFLRHQVNVINVSVRHAKQDSGSLLAWAKEEVFAFVVWYKQWTTDTEKGKVGVWTRELVEAAVSLNGSYYLPYQAHATAEQFHRAYPNRARLFDMKAKLDPGFKFRNVIWDTYYINHSK